MSLPLLPSFDMRLGLGVEEVVVVDIPLTSGEVLEPLKFVEDVVRVLLDLEGGAAEGFTW